MPEVRARDPAHSALAARGLLCLRRICAPRQPGPVPVDHADMGAGARGGGVMDRDRRIAGCGGASILVIGMT